MKLWSIIPVPKTRKKCLWKFQNSLFSVKVPSCSNLYIRVRTIKTYKQKEYETYTVNMFKTKIKSTWLWDQDWRDLLFIRTTTEVRVSLRGRWRGRESSNHVIRDKLFKSLIDGGVNRQTGLLRGEQWGTIKRRDPRRCRVCVETVGSKK